MPVQFISRIIRKTTCECPSRMSRVEFLILEKESGTERKGSGEWFNQLADPVFVLHLYGHWERRGCLLF